MTHKTQRASTVIDDEMILLLVSYVMTGNAYDMVIHKLDAPCADRRNRSELIAFARRRIVFVDNMGC